ncbi:MAG: hypothetical protein GQF41_0280 [Candidatus Rifleibacterium amylolyticum]|nr:MAG: hypothetical protein GQF41_0280 [Candidatus Rifleibacterium amylolyticum]
MYKRHLGFLFVLCTLVLLGGCSNTSSESRASSWLGGGANDDSPTIYRLTIQTDSQVIGIGQTLPLLFKLTSFGGVPVNSGTINLISSNGGSFDGDSETNAKGLARKIFTAGNTAGTTLISASYMDAVATVSVQIQPVSVGVAKVTVFVASEQIKPEQTMPIQIYIADDTGAPLNATDVKLFAAEGGSFASSEGTTSEGWFSTDFTAGAAVGQETITAMSLGQTGSKTISVRN